ncbi:MAG TPA: ABC transporter ATP-binding protein [Gaiellaceae bacterium]|nr:ABC transporter ATP-binding protein [Gaiellaceae bacterium]
MKRLTRASSAVESATIWALRDVSFEIRSGEAVGIIGRNGAGKSTLLKILSRITRPTTGHARVHGRVGSLLEVGTGFHGELTGRENIFLNGALLGLTKSEIERRFDEIVAFSEVEEFLDTPVKRYSSGMTVRLAFAVAAHLDPEILLVDEVLAVGDLGFQRKCLGRMTEVAASGRTVLFVSHNMAVIRALCSRGIYLEHGGVHTDGTADAAVGAYLRSLEEQAGVLDLSERSDREGWQNVRIERIVVHSASASAVTLTSGGPALFRFDLSGVLRGLSCTVAIHDQLGHLVTTMSSSQAAPDDLWEPQAEPFFECAVPELLLVPGRYRLDVTLRGAGHVQDQIEAAAYFEVVEGLLRGRPVSGGSAAGSIAMPVRWRGPEAGVA